MRIRVSLSSLGFLALLLLAPLLSQAKQVGPAGCGLGSIIWGKDSQVLASSSNMSGTQVFGILFGTSNCAPQTKETAVVAFVQTNEVALANDAARGHGETVKALSHLLGCSNSQALGSALKQNYEEIFAEKKNDPTAITHEIKETVVESRLLSRSCAHD